MAANKIKLLAIVGQTASGKTALGIKLAKMLNGEIIAADSRTVYKGLNIGTAKPTLAERSGIKHYGFDLIEPNERYNAAEFKKMAQVATQAIWNKGKLPIIVGGTGLYIDAFLYDYQLMPPNIELRRQLSNRTIEELQAIIASKGLPMPFNKVNKIHLISTIERNGQPAIRNHSLPKGYLIVGLKPAKKALEERIKKRANNMFKQGVIEEAQQALRLYGKDAPGLNGGIYKQITHYLSGKIVLAECQDLFIKSDKNLAKRQLTWFKRNDDIRWFEKKDQATEYIKTML